MTAPAGDARARTPVTVAVVDDHPTTRAGTRLLLTDAGHRVIAEAGTLAGARDILGRRPAPTVLVLDLNLPDGHALRHLPALRKAAPDVPILILSAQDDTPVIRAVLDAGAAGYLLKDAPATELAAAVTAVATGGRYVQPHLAERLARRAGALAPAGRPLTERQEAALRLWADGFTHAQVAKELSVSLRTVEALRAELRTNLGLETRAELAAYARAHLA